MVILDTDVLLLAYAFKRDVRQPVNQQFLARVQSKSPAITVYNLMEILGQISFNLAPNQLQNWNLWLIGAYNLTVLWPVNPQEPISGMAFADEIFEQPYQRMLRYGSAFMDTLILNLAERTPNAECFVTWNAKHFRGKSSLQVLTPEEFLTKNP
ncbi:MAG: hypothetical protein OHK0052_06710 [Anaerolineales bacterium]